MQNLKFKLTCLALLSPTLLLAQFILSGKIVDKNNVPIPFTEVFLISTNSNSFKSVFSNETGIFSIGEIAGEYNFKIKQKGALLLEKSFLLDKNIELGVIKVKTLKTLKEVTVISKKKRIERKVDRFVYNVENSISSTGGDAIDVLKSTPSLIVTDNSIGFVGKSSMSVLVNDRLIQLSGEELSNYLKTLPSESISKIEVITTPPAKYDSEGNSGLINIVLKKAKKDSFNGNFRTTYTQAKYGSESNGGSLNYQKNKISIISGLDFLRGISAPYQEYDIYYPNYTWNESYKTKNLRNNINGRFALEYNVTPKTLIGFEYNKITNKSEVNSSNNSRITNKPRNELDSLIVTRSLKNIQRKTNSLNLHILSKLDTLGRSVSVDLDYFEYNTNTGNKFNTSTYLPTGQLKPNRLFFVNNLGKQNIKIYSSKIDYTLPLSWINFSFGGKLSLLKTDNEFMFFNLIADQSNLDVSKSNRFVYSESNHAIYITSSKKISERWDSQIGLRSENTNLEGKSIELNQINKSNYTQLFPSFYLSYTNKNENVYTLNYSRRIERPSYFLLNPYKIYSTINNFTQGNPNLSPYYSNNLELSLVKGSFYHSIYFSYLDKGIDQLTITIPTSNYQYTFPYNFFTTRRIGVSENYTFQKITGWQSNNGFNIFYTNTHSSLPQTFSNINGFTCYLSSFNNLSLNSSKSLKVEINFIYQTSAVSNSYTTSPFYSVDSGMRYEFLNKKLQFSLNITDVFKTSGIVFTNNINNIRQEKYDYSDAQKIKFSLVYKFGKPMKDTKRNFSNEEEKKRTR